MQTAKQDHKAALLKRVAFLFSAGFLLFGLLRAGLAQSTLEYATLLTEKAAAGAASEEENSGEGHGPGGIIQQGAGMASHAMTSAYSDAAETMSLGGALMERAGGGPGSSEQGPSEPIAQKTTEENGTRVHLKNGQIIEGRLVEQGDNFVKIETAGIVVTYFNEEVEKILVPEYE